jgi:hypothetical protein
VPRSGKKLEFLVQSMDFISWVLKSEDTEVIRSAPAPGIACFCVTSLRDVIRHERKLSRTRTLESSTLQAIHTSLGTDSNACSIVREMWYSWMGLPKLYCHVSGRAITCRVKTWTSFVLLSGFRLLTTLPILTKRASSLSSISKALSR